MFKFLKEGGGRMIYEWRKGMIAFFVALVAGLVLASNGFAGGNPANGKDLFMKNCVVCHGDKGQGRGGPAGWFTGGGGEISPLIGNQLSNQVFLATASDEFIRYTIENGRPGRAMVTWKGKLKDSEIADVVAFLRSWQKAPSIKLTDEPAWGNPAAGGELFGAICTPCHGVKGKGTDQAPALNVQTFLDVASDDFIRQTMHKGRPGTVMRSFLKGNDEAVVELEPRQIEDIIAYVRTWDKKAKGKIESWLMK
ncbi:MAG: c-type cytochrome [Deltaproteobacteria bacterium]|nr:c-type cytochrome [Deltaproteobacteria bacterium]